VKLIEFAQKFIAMSFDWKVKTKENADSIELKSFELEILREKLSNYTAYF